MGAHRACFIVIGQTELLPWGRFDPGNDLPILHRLPLVAHQLASAREIPAAVELGSASDLEPHAGRASAHFLVDGKELTESGRNPRKALISGVSTRRRSGRAANTVLPEQSPNRRENPRIRPCS